MLYNIWYSRLLMNTIYTPGCEGTVTGFVEEPFAILSYPEDGDISSSKTLKL